MSKRASFLSIPGRYGDLDVTGDPVPPALSFPESWEEASDLDNWTVYKKQAGLTVEINTATPILGAGSLRMNNTGEGTVLNLTNVVGTSYYTPGLTHGSMRALFNISAGANRSRLGFSFLQSTQDITADTGAWYDCVMEADFSGTVRRLLVFRYDDGFDQEATFLQVGSPAFTGGVTFSMEVEWQINTPIAGTTRIITRQGSATDFSDLAQVGSTIEDTSGLSASLGESVYALKWDTFGDVYEMFVDQTTVTDLS